MAENDPVVDPEEPGRDDSGTADKAQQEKQRPPHRRRGAPPRARARIKAQEEGLPKWFWIAAAVGAVLVALLVILVLIFY